MTRGTLYLVPNALDVGTPEAERVDLRERLPHGTIACAARLGDWLGESAKTTRAFLKRVDAVCKLARPLQEIAIVELPRPPKGGAAGARATTRRAEPPSLDAAALLAPAFAGRDVGLVSEAGLPALADPGALVVAAAHAAGIRVVGLPGASAIALAVAASGLNGQSFAFVGYLPVASDARGERIRELEAVSRRLGQTQLAIEAPYRNAATLAALVASLQPQTVLSVSVGLTLVGEATTSRTVARWRAEPLAIANDVPAVFAWLAR